MKQLFVVAVLVGALALAAPAQAEMKLGEARAEFKEKVQEAKEERKENVMERKENREERRNERQEQRGENRDERLERIANRVEARFANHASWLTKWLERAQSRSEVLKAKGKDTAGVNTAIATAKTNLEKAKSLGSASVAALRAVEAEAWSEQKPDAKAARTAVTEAQKAFAQVLKDLQTIVAELRKINPEPSKAVKE